MTDFIGTPGDDRLVGGDLNDSFDISQGGADTVKAGGGDDTINAGAAFSADDQINGGDGNDTLNLDGDYSSGVVFGARTLVNVENIELGVGFSYDLTLSDRSASSNGAAGLSISAGADIGADQHIRIDASALLATSRLNFSVAVSASSVVIGGAGADTMVFDGSGQFDVSGGGGDDTVAIYRGMTQADHFDGGAGIDTLVLFAPQTAAFSGRMLVDVDAIMVYFGDFSFSMRDTAVTAGQTMRIDASNLTAGQHLAFDGSKETDGAFNIIGGADGDTLTGGRGDDTIAAGTGDDRITGGGGADILSGEGGSDTFVYLSLGDSGHHGQFDLITDLQAGDVIDLSALDANSIKAGDQAFHLVSAFTGHAGELMLSYDAASDLTTLAIDVNGDAKADMAVHIAGDQHSFTNFVL